MKIINTALIAAGRIGVMHGEDILQLQSVNLKTVMDKHLRGDFLNKYDSSAQVTKNIDDVWNDPKIDCLVIAASSAAHVELVETAIKNKKHIFCEKPVSFDSRELYRLACQAKEAGVFFQVAYNRRFDPDFNRVKEYIDQGKTGRLYMIKIINRDPVRPPIEFVPNSGGLFFDFNTHDFDMVHFISGEDIQEVQAFGASLVDPEIGKLGDIDTTLINLKLESGALVGIDSSRETGYGYDQELEVFGSKGSVKAHNLRENTLMVSSNNEVRIARPRENFMVRYREAYQIQIASFFNRLRDFMEQGDTIQPEVSGFDAARAVAVAEAVDMSFKTSTVVKVDYPGE